MLSALTRTQARLLALLLVAACAWSATLSPSVSETPAGLPPYSDMVLYHDIAAQVAGGKGYYAAATELQTAHGFPTKPFVTVRTPVLTWMAVTMGWQAMQAVLAALLGLAIALWYRRLEGAAASSERIGVIVLMLAGGAMASQLLLVAQHEVWAGILLSIAMLLRGGKHWLWALLCAALALAIRELALPFVLLALAFALVERRRNEALGWAALLALFAAGMALHAAAVAAAAAPSDIVSQGWHALRGPGAVLQDLVDVSLITLFPDPLAYPLALLALLGWAAMPLKQARFALLWFLGFALMLALFARAQNFYWAIMLLPAWFMGLAFLPRALVQLWQAASAKPGP